MGLLNGFMSCIQIIYSNKSWCIVRQGMFAHWEINQMKQEMCFYLEWQLNIDPLTLCDFPPFLTHT